MEQAFANADLGRVFKPHQRQGTIALDVGDGFRVEASSTIPSIQNLLLYLTKR